MKGEWRTTSLSGTVHLTWFGREETFCGKQRLFSTIMPIQAVTCIPCMAVSFVLAGVRHTHLEGQILMARLTVARER